MTWKRKRKVRVSQGERKGASKEMEEESFAFLKVRNSITNRRKDRKTQKLIKKIVYSYCKISCSDWVLVEALVSSNLYHKIVLYMIYKTLRLRCIIKN